MAWYGNPLPAGWEAKWDPGQQRYFFIDHVSKKTTWVDPRSSGVPQRPQQPQYNPYGNQSAIPMQAPYSGGGSTSRQTDREVETSFTAKFEPDKELLRKLKSEFPGASESEIKDALESSSNQESGARREIEREGHVSLSNVMNKLKGRYPDVLEDILESAAITCDCNETDIYATLKDMGYLTANEKKEQQQAEKDAAEKNKARVETVIRKEFVHLDFFSINNALKASGYNEDIARAILKSVDESKKQKTTVSPPSSSSGARAAPSSSSSSSAATTSAASKKPTASPRKTAPTSNKTAATSVTPKTTTATPRKATTTTNGTAPSSAAKNKTNTEAPKVTATTKTITTASLLKKSAKTDPRAKSSTKTTQMTIRSRNFSHNIARGPDPSLAKGPQDSLLIKGYTAVYGPDASLVKGPTCRAYHSQGALGPDPTLVHGPSHRQRFDVYI